MKHRRLRSIVASLTAVTWTAAMPGAAIDSQGRIGNAPVSTIEAAQDAAYNLDNPEALALARRAVQEAPHEPASHRGLASILWLNILFVRGAVTIDHYLGGSI